MSKGNEFEFQKGAGTKPECDGNYGGKNRDHTCHGTALTQRFIDFRGLLEFLSKHAAGAMISSMKQPDPHTSRWTKPTENCSHQANP